MDAASSWVGPGSGGATGSITGRAGDAGTGVTGTVCTGVSSMGTEWIDPASVRGTGTAGTGGRARSLSSKSAQIWFRLCAASSALLSSASSKTLSRASSFSRKILSLLSSPWEAASATSSMCVSSSAKRSCLSRSASAKVSSGDLGLERLERERPGGGTCLGLAEREEPDALTMTDSSGVTEVDRGTRAVLSASEGG